MTNTSPTNYYAASREPTLFPEQVHIFSRPSIHQAETNTNEWLINNQSGTLEMLAIQSNHVSRYKTPFRTELKAEMLSESGLRGSEGTIKCPFMKIGFTNALKSDYEPPSAADGGDNRLTLFDRGWDGEIVFTNTRIGNSFFW